MLCVLWYQSKIHSRKLRLKAIYLKTHVVAYLSKLVRQYAAET